MDGFCVGNKHAQQGAAADAQKRRAAELVRYASTRPVS